MALGTRREIRIRLIRIDAVLDEIRDKVNGHGPYVRHDHATFWYVVTAKFVI